MEWFWLLLTVAILFLLVLAVFYRLVFIRGYKAGARRVLAEWKQSLNEEDVIHENDRDI